MRRVGPSSRRDFLKAQQMLEEGWGPLEVSNVTGCSVSVAGLLDIPLIRGKPKGTMLMVDAHGKTVPFDQRRVPPSKSS